MKNVHQFHEALTHYCNAHKRPKMNCCLSCPIRKETHCRCKSDVIKYMDIIEPTLRQWESDCITTGIRNTIWRGVCSLDIDSLMDVKDYVNNLIKITATRAPADKP